MASDSGRQPKFTNPFKPGAGHMPPYLAGRESEAKEFRRLLGQTTILENLVLTGLRGLGKTVLLERFKPLAIQEGWLWAGTDLSESTSISEENLSIRLLTDLSVVTSSVPYRREPKIGVANATEDVTSTLDYATLAFRFGATPGLVADKLKETLEFVWSVLQKHGKRGIIFAYDEAQNLADHAARNQFPLSLLLDVFQSIQRKDIPFMLVLTGLPTLFPKLVEARTFAERMFRVVFLDPLNEKETGDAILRPIKDQKCPVQFSPESVRTIWEVSKGYPYFVQYVCRECYDVWVQETEAGKSMSRIPVPEIVAKLDSDFFAGRWARATDRQRELLSVVASLPNCESEFTVQELTESPSNRALKKSFSGSHANQMLAVLTEAGLTYKNRHGKYSFAVPLLGGFIRRQKSYKELQLTHPSAHHTA